jgi:hypothetical protein
MLIGLPSCSSDPAARHTLLSALRGPGPHTGDPIHRDVSDISARWAVHGRKADIRAKIGAGEALEKFGCTSLGDAELAPRPSAQPGFAPGQ